MKEQIRSIYRKIKTTAVPEDGGNLVEYVLLLALVACGTTAGQHSMASGIGQAYVGISSHLSSVFDSGSGGGGSGGGGNGGDNGNGNGNGGGNGNVGGNGNGGGRGNGGGNGGGGGGGNGGNGGGGRG